MELEFFLNINFFVYGFYDVVNIIMVFFIGVGYWVGLICGYIKFFVIIIYRYIRMIILCVE